MRATAADEILRSGSSLMSHRPQRARPLSNTSELMLYKSAINIQGVAAAARQNCLVGSGLAVAGFGVLIASVAPAVPPPVFVAMLGGALANCYALCVIALRVVRGLAARHVEQLVLLPTPDFQEPEEMKESGSSPSLLLHEMASAATAEERLKITPEVHLEIRTANADTWITLVDPPEDVAVDGSADCRAPFGELCSELRVLHMDTESATLCPDAALLSALMESRKVAVEERREARGDSAVTSVLQIPEGAAVPGPMLSDFTVGDIEEARRTVSVLPPEHDINKIGRRARNGGLAILMTGSLFAIGESCRDADGVPRYTNLPI